MIGRTNITSIAHLGLILLLVIPGSIIGQLEYEQHSHKIDPAGGYRPSSSAQQYSPVVIPAEMPSPLDQKFARAERKGPATLQAQSTEARASLGNAPGVQILDTLQGNSFNGSVPNDDSYAINSDGQAIVVRNTTIAAYQVEKDSLLFKESLFNFYRPLPPLPGSKYDPRTIYDPEADRFIVVYLSGNTYQSSKIVLGFSRTADPSDGFYMYQLEGNPLQDSTWSDYPHISLSKEDLFITVNTFYNGSVNNSGYVQSTIRQLDKSAGYDSLPIQEHYYSNLRYNGQALFNFTGMTGGRQLYSAPMYFLGNQNLDSQNDSLYLVSIDDSSRGNPQMTLQVYRAAHSYGHPPAARQANNHTFDCNDARVQGGFLQDQRIQFVGNTITPDSSAGIYHGIIDLQDPPAQAVYFKILSFDPIDVGYPKISYTGKTPAEREAILTFNHSSDSLFAGFSAVFFDNDSSYSDLDTLIQGGDYVDIISGSQNNRFYERWGDYTGAQVAYGDTGVIWASGYQASAQGTPLTTIVKLRSPNYQARPIGLALQSRGKRTSTSLAPNPADQWFDLRFEGTAKEVRTFELLRIDGAQTGQAAFQSSQLTYPGTNTFRFRTENLAPGSYLLLMKTRGGTVLARERVILR